MQVQEVLKFGKRYDMDNLVFRGWKYKGRLVPSTDLAGFVPRVFFDLDGRYRGPTEDGCEPVFAFDPKQQPGD
jgi:hypothetical protein